MYRMFGSMVRRSPATAINYNSGSVYPGPREEIYGTIMYIHAGKDAISSRPFLFLLVGNKKTTRIAPGNEWYVQ